MIRLLAFDLDDTLLNEDGKLTARTKRALRSAMDAGAKVCISSGRMVEASEGIASEIGVNAPCVLYNGALIYDFAEKRALHTLAVPMETARAIARYCEARNYYLQTYPGEGYYAQAHTVYTDEYAGRIHVNCRFTGVALSEWISSDAVKMLMIGEREKMAASRAALAEAFPAISFMASRPTYTEIVAKQADKGSALLKLCGMLGIDPAEAAAFGDAQNDVGMLKAVGYGCAVANAPESVRAQARFIAPANGLDGVAIRIEGWLAAGEIGRG